MRADYINGNIRAVCRNCGVPVTFERSDNGREFGSYQMPSKPGHARLRVPEPRIVFQLFRCAGCGAGAVAAIECYQQVTDGRLLDFFPTATENLPLPKDMPADLLNEFREAEHCMANLAYRGASALFRSALEKALKQNGIPGKNLLEQIDQAVKDGVLTKARAERAHSEIRVLGNDVLHDDWRPIDEKEITACHMYTHRILEELYDDRKTVENVLRTAGRLPHKQ